MDKRDRVKWIAYGSLPHTAYKAPDWTYHYVWTIEEVSDGFVCVCYDHTEPDGIAVNFSDPTRLRVVERYNPIKGTEDVNRDDPWHAFNPEE